MLQQFFQQVSVVVVGPNGSTAEKQFMSFIESCQGQCVAGVWVMQHMSRATPHSHRQARTRRQMTVIVRDGGLLCFYGAETRKGGRRQAGLKLWDHCWWGHVAQWKVEGEETEQTTLPSCDHLWVPDQINKHYSYENNAIISLCHIGL